MWWPFRNKDKPEKRSEEQTEETTSNEVEVSADLLRALLASTEITRSQAMMIPAFAACVNKISETIGEVPIKLYRRTGADVEEITDDDRTMLLNYDTGDTFTGEQFKRALARDYLLGKGGYAYINKHGNRFVSLNYVKEEEISFLVNDDPIFKDYNIQVRGAQYIPARFLKILRNTRNGWAGTSIIEENMKALAVAYATMILDETLAETGGSKRGYIESDNRLSEAAMETLKEAWKNLYQNNTDSVVILNKGLKFHDASATSTELQLNENKNTNSDDICKLFGMPPGMINGGATEEEKTIFIQYCVNPILEELCCSLNRDLLLEKEKRNKFFAADTSEFTKGDIEKRYNAYSTGIKNGFMQIDEVRRRENMAPLGIDFIKFGLQDVFYDKDTGEFYTPNMNQSGKIGEDEGKKPEKAPDDGEKGGKTEGES